ncbi:ABC transporter, ATP-binding protein [Trichuris suis]|nr:ABC transporter, ATP-binding protein [Trichuris suis]
MAASENEKQALLPSEGEKPPSSIGSYGSVDSLKSSAKGSDKSRGIFSDLFYFADSWDYILMFVGTIFAIIHGAGWPTLSIITGHMTDTFIRAQITDFTSNTSWQEAAESIAPLLSLSNHNSSAQNISLTLRQITVIEFVKAIKMYTLFYLLIGALMFVTSYAQIACWSSACERQTHRIRKQFFKSVLHMEIAWYDRSRSGELTSKLNDDIERVREGIGDKVSLLCQYTAAFVSGFTIGFFYSWKLSLVMMSLSPLLALSSAWFSAALSYMARREQKLFASASAVAEEAISSIRTVLAFNGQKNEINRYKKALEETRRLGYRKNLVIGFGFLITFVSTFSTYALAFWYGSKLIDQDPLLPRGAIFTVFFAIMAGSMAFGSAAPHLTTIAIARGSASSVIALINTKPSIDSSSELGLHPNNIEGNVEFNHVTFSYRLRPEFQVLKSLSFVIAAGQRIAIVGESGSGKSTAVNLLLRFYDCANGACLLINSSYRLFQIYIDGFNVKVFNVHALRSMIGVVSQEPVLFDGTVEENIRLGKLDATLEEIKNAAILANAFGFVSALPQGFGTRVGERGVQLSGGQKQRIAIARALIRNPKILLLDEATSALDTESEGVVQEALCQAQKNRTTIAIAHRLSTIKDYDKIFVLKNGVIREQGSHEELMQQRAIYYSMVLAQQIEENAMKPSEQSDSSYSSSEQHESYVSEQRDDAKPGFPREGIQKKVSMPEKQDRTPTYGTISAGKPDHSVDDETAEKQKILSAGFWSIVSSSKKNWHCLLFGSIGCLLSGTVMPAFSLFFSQVFYAYSEQGKDMLNDAMMWSLLLFMLGFVQGFSTLLAAFCFGKAGEDLTLMLRVKLLENLLRQEVSYFDHADHSTGQICTRLATDVPNIRAAVGYRAATVVTSAVSLASAVVIAFVFGWKLALVVIILVPVMICSSYLDMKIKMRNQRRDDKLLENAGKVFTEAVQNIRCVQSLCRERHFYTWYCSYLTIPFRASLRQAQFYALSFGFSQSVIFFMYAIAFRYGGYLVGIGDMKPLDVYRVFFALTFCGMSMGQASCFIPDLAKARVSAASVFRMIQTKPKIDSCSAVGLKPALTGKARMKGVHFAYPARPDVPIFRGLNLNVFANKTLAIVGPSGCGKSTVISLFQRFYDPNRGTIRYDDHSLKILNLHHVRKSIGLVSQEPVLFNVSLRQNIVYGLEERVPHSKVVEAAKLANIHEFILSLPLGYNTLAGERGLNLSGGQKQRIAIARALVRDPKILMLDEATSALDTESETVVQDAIEKAQVGRTSILIAHRLSTVQNAHWIVVMKEGSIVESGNFICNYLTGMICYL